MPTRPTLSSLFQPLLLILMVLWIAGCPIDPNSNSCCLLPDNSVTQSQTGVCLQKQGVSVSSEACTDKSKVLTTLCQRYIGFCTMSVGFCVNTWQNSLKPNAPWYEANKCLQELALSSSDFCNEGNNCFKKLEQGTAQVSVRATDGNSFSTKITQRSTTYSIELLVELNDKRSLVITIHSKPAKQGTYILAKDNSRGATLLYKDKEGKEHPSVSGTLTLSTIENNKVSGTFTFKNEADVTIQGTLTEAPLPQ